MISSAGSGRISGRSGAFLAAVFLLLGACAPRPGGEVLAPVAVPADPPPRIVSVLVATTRTPAAEPALGFTSDRSPVLHYVLYDISIPPGHVEGQIEWPEEQADPGTSFVIAAKRDLTATEFEREVARRSRKATGDAARASIFVHGFNYTFSESLYRMAQLAFETGTPAVPILFSWPSEARVSMYTADKDGATFSRDGLTRVLSQVSSATSGHVLVLGHSMGGWLTTEAVRQLALTRQTGVLNDLQVVLAAPDIDADVFRQQLRTIGRMQQPMIVLVSTDDRALSFSRVISGSRPRLGSLDISNPEVQEEARDANVRVIDISSIQSDDLLHHDRFVALAGLYPEVRAAQAQAPLRHAGAFIFNVFGATLNAAGEVLDQASR